jgi:hypothetical protein
MDDKGIVEQLEFLNTTTARILAAMQKPMISLERIVGVVAMGAGALGIFGVVDILLRWLTER